MYVGDFIARVASRRRAISRRLGHRASLVWRASRERAKKQTASRPTGAYPAADPAALEIAECLDDLHAQVRCWPASIAGRSALTQERARHPLRCHRRHRDRRLRPTFRTTGTIAIVPTQPLLDNHRGSTACGTTRAMKSPTYTQIACELRLRYVQLLQNLPAGAVAMLSRA